MIGILPVIDREGIQVATLEWKGTMWAGKGTWKWFADKDVKSKITNAIKTNAELRLDTFADMVRDAGGVKGWQGFAGWFQALGLALPAYGLDVDDSNIVWPYKQIGEPE